MEKIGILTALFKEGELIEKTLGKPLKTDLYGHFLVKTYRYKEKTVYLCNSGVGEISASACTQLLIAVYGVEFILNYGFAGGYNNYKIGDSVLINGVVHYDFDTSKIDDCKPGQYFGLFEEPVISTDEKSLAFVKNLSSDVKEGILCSGDKFIADESFKKRLYDEFGGSVYDMEGAGVVIICKTQKIPHAIVKVISDNGNATEYYAFKDLLCDTKVKFVDLIEKILEKL